MWQHGMSVQEALTMPKRLNVSALDTESVTIGGETHTMREWCKINGVVPESAMQIYRKTGDAHYSVLDHMAKMRYRRERGEILDEENKWQENELSIHPTPEVVEMCTNCIHPDCTGRITRCLRLKRMREANGVI